MSAQRRQPLWIRLLFRKSGKPKKVLRRALFHANGRPRGVFRSLVLHEDGRPHSPFRDWMLSDAYQSLPSAVQLGDRFGSGPVDLSPDAARLSQRLSAFRTSVAQKD